MSLKVKKCRCGSSTFTLGGRGAASPKWAGNWKDFVGYMYKYAVFDINVM